MKVRLDYGQTGLEVEVPDRAQVLQMAGALALENLETRLAEALLRPIGTPALRRLAQGRQNACVVISDITRPVPNALILPPILRTLEEAGIPRECITVLVATGLHRPNEGEELVALVGAQIAGQYRILNHRARDRETLVYLGQTSCGAPIWIDRVYGDAMVRTASPTRMRHLEQVMANDGHLAELSRQARERMSEPSRG